MAVVEGPVTTAGERGTGARTYLAYAVAVVLAAQVCLLMTAVHLDQHRVDGGAVLDAHSYMDNAGAGLGWLMGSIVAPVLSLALLAVAKGRRDHAGVVLALTLAVLAATALGPQVPVMGLVQGTATCAAMVLAFLLARVRPTGRRLVGGPKRT